MDKLRVTDSYNAFIGYYLLADMERLEKHRLVSNIMKHIELSNSGFNWELDKLVSYVNKQREVEHERYKKSLSHLEGKRAKKL